MPSRYKVGEDAIPHFVTFSVVGWIDVFTRESYKEIIVESLSYKFGSAINYYTNEQGLLKIEHLEC